VRKLTKRSLQAPRRRDEGFPSSSDEPTLEDWLESQRGRLVQRTYSRETAAGGVPSHVLEVWKFPNGRVAVVVVQAGGLGWDIATGSGGDDPDSVLDDAESRLGLPNVR
jgi:hypothetical protein